jgi:hypothetical protein
MTIKPPPSHEQPMLFDVLPDKPLLAPGEARTRYGKVVEEIVIELLKLTDIPNSGSHNCVFDAHHKSSGTYCEIKSLRQGNKLPVYEWRRKKDRECGVPLVYLIGIHRCTKQKTLGDVWNVMADTLDTILVLPASVIDAEAEKHELRQLVKQGPPGERQGYRRAGYCDGYHNIPEAALTGMVAGQDARTAFGSKYDLLLFSRVHFHHSITPWLPR